MIKFIFVTFFLLNCERKSGQFEIFTNNFDKTKIICASITEDQDKTIQYKYYNTIMKQLAKNEGFKIDTKNCDYVLEFDLTIKPINAFNTDSFYLGILAFFWIKTSEGDVKYSKELRLNILDKNNRKVVEGLAIVDDLNKVKSPIINCMIEHTLKNIKSTSGVDARSQPFSCN